MAITYYCLDENININTNMNMNMNINIENLNIKQKDIKNGNFHSLLFFFSSYFVLCFFFFLKYTLQTNKKQTNVLFLQMWR